MRSEATRFEPEPKGAALALKIWMLEHGASLKELADALGCSISAVSSWRSGVHAPSRAQAVRLELITAGAVTAGSWDAQ